MLRRAIPFLAALALAPTAVAPPALADMRDVKVGVAGARADILIEFDASPTAAAAGPQADGLVVHASGVSARPRRIETVSGGIVTAVVVREGEGGVEIDLHLAREAVSAQARLEGRALRVVLELAEPLSVSGGAPAATLAQAPSAPMPTPSAMVATEPATAPPPTASAQLLGEEESPVVRIAPTASPPSPGSAPSALVAAATPPELRLGGAESARAAAPAAADGAGGSGRPASPRDPSRPTVIFAGGLTDDDCLAAETAIRNDPWDLGSLKRYASCEALRGEAAEAETAFRRLLTFTPEDPDAELGLAAVRHEQGFASEAAATYQRLLEDATGDAEAARLRALLALAAAGR